MLTKVLEKYQLFVRQSRQAPHLWPKSKTPYLSHKLRQNQASVYTMYLYLLSLIYHKHQQTPKRQKHISNFSIQILVKSQNTKLPQVRSEQC